jgi:hypothetical protein
MYRECVHAVGAKALVQYAKHDDGAIEWSGLRKYGYCDEKGNFLQEPK